jgi:hypothetical protein
MNKIEDVKAGRLKVDKEMDELTMALGNPEHLGRCRGYWVVSWKYAFKGNLDSNKSRKSRKERKENHWLASLYLSTLGAPLRQGSCSSSSLFVCSNL